MVSQSNPLKKKYPPAGVAVGTGLFCVCIRHRSTSLTAINYGLAQCCHLICSISHIADSMFRVQSSAEEGDKACAHLLAAEQGAEDADKQGEGGQRRRGVQHVWPLLRKVDGGLGVRLRRRQEGRLVDDRRQRVADLLEDAGGRLGRLLLLLAGGFLLRLLLLRLRLLRGSQDPGSGG